MPEVAEIALIPNYKDFFSLLDKYLNKGIKEGCFFIDKFHWDNCEDNQYNKIISIGKEYEGTNMIYYISDYNSGTHLHSINGNYLLNERENYRKKNENTGDLRYKILGQIPTNSIILKYIDDNVGLYNLSINNITYLEEYFRDINPKFIEPINMDSSEIIKVINYIKNLQKYKIIN